jgi:hypothetical protein
VVREFRGGRLFGRARGIIELFSNNIRYLSYFAVPTQKA